MAFVKQTLSPFSTRAADPLFEFEEPYIQYGVISGQSYTAEQVSYGLPKASYLQIAANSDIVTVVGSADAPVRIVFALGLHDANTGGEIGAWRSFTGKSTANSSVTVSVNESAWIYAEIDENGQPNNLNAWTIDYYSESSVGRTYTTSRTEPTSPANGDVWFDVINNQLFKYNTDSSSWEYKKRVYLGEAGVGTNDYLYSIQSWYPNRGYADFEDSNYVFNENPWRHYDGVSFTTNGQYTAMEASVWANNATIGQAVSGNRIAMEAIANSASAMASIAVSQNTLTYIANSSVAMSALVANSSAISFLANSTIAQTAIQTSNNELALLAIANSATALQGVVNNSQTTLLFDLVANANAYNIIINNSALYNVVANSTTGPILATGGNTVSVITDGGVDYRVHQFTGIGTLDVLATGEQSTNIQYLVIAGGGGASTGTNNHGGGGNGAGGYRTNVPGQLSGGSPGTAEPALTVSKQSYVVTVGGGGAAVAQISTNVGREGNNGTNSSFSTITSVGGGSGSAFISPVTPGFPGNAKVGGSGGGGSGGNGAYPGAAGIPGQGSAGGNLTPGNPLLAPGPAGAGGGGAGGAGTSSTAPFPGSSPAGGGICGRGGVGRTSPITGSSVGYAGGGDGGTQGHVGFIVNTSAGGGTPFGGGFGGGPQTYVPGGTASGSPLAQPLLDGQANKGGGGGGHSGSGSVGVINGGNGGSGFIVIRYPVERV